MLLRQILQTYCKNNGLEDLACIIHISLLNYISSLYNKDNGVEYVNISSVILSSSIGIKEEQVIELLKLIEEKSEDIIKIEYRFNCKEYKFTDDFGLSIEKDSFEDGEESFDPCMKCDSFHRYNLTTDKYELGFIGNIQKIKEELRLTNEDITKELVVLNTNEEHVDKLAELLVSRLNIASGDKEEAKRGITGYLQSFRGFTKALADISEDSATITGNVKKVAEDVSGFSSLKNLFISAEKEE